MKISPVRIGVNSGARTHDPQSHNLMLYQLSYIHHTDDGGKYTDFMTKINPFVTIPPFLYIFS